MRLKWLEVSNHVRNWNNVENFIFVESKIELCQLEMPTFIYKWMCQSSLIKLFHFCSVNLIGNELKWRQKCYFSTFISSNSQIEILLSFSRSTNVNVNMSFPNSNFEGDFSTYVFGKSFSHYRHLKSELIKLFHFCSVNLIV